MARVILRTGSSFVGRNPAVGRLLDLAVMGTSGWSYEIVPDNYNSTFHIPPSTVIASASGDWKLATDTGGTLLGPCKRPGQEHRRSVRDSRRGVSRRFE